MGGDAAGGDRQRAVVDAVEDIAGRACAMVMPWAMTVPLRLMLPPTVLKVAEVSWFCQA